MYVQLEKNFQKDLLEKAVSKAGSERKLKKLLNIPLVMIYYYKNEIHRLPEYRFDLILKFLGLKKSKISFGLIDEKEFRVNGGKRAFQKQFNLGEFSKAHKKMQQASSKYMKKWHKEMKTNYPEKYYELQYSRFKKISKYELTTINGLCVRNELEKLVGDYLFFKGFSFQYEPFIKIKDKAYFPDFVCGEIIIECTSWKGKGKSFSLKKKIKDFESAGYVVFVVIPRGLASFYKPIEKNIIYLEELVEHETTSDKILGKPCLACSSVNTK